MVESFPDERIALNGPTPRTNSSGLRPTNFASTRSKPALHCWKPWPGNDDLVATILSLFENLDVALRRAIESGEWLDSASSCSKSWREFGLTWRLAASF